MATAVKERPAKAEAAAVEEKPEPTSWDGTVTLPAAQLARIIRVSDMARSKDDNRPILTSLYVDWDGSKMTVVTTDSYRLYVQHTRIDAVDSTPFRALLPGAALKRWASQPFGRLAEVTLSVADGKVRLSTDGEQLQVNVVAGVYPSWEKMTEPIVDDGAEVQTAFNPRYLADVFKAATLFSPDWGTTVRVAHLDPVKPCLFRVTRASSDRLDMLLMPVRVP